MSIILFDSGNNICNIIQMNWKIICIAVLNLYGVMEDGVFLLILTA